MRALLRLAPLALALPLAVPPALAQGIIRPQSPQATPTPGPAPALPGLAARRAPAPIPGEANANLSPNAALFDAINRGDLAAARDAVTRGANLEARNAIGLTPLDAAVDQGRNDIVFYLLSARDLARGPTGEPAPASLGGPPPAAPAAAAPRRDVFAAPQPAARAAQPATPRAARLWANDGGDPRPEVGFLGFDAGRPAGAEPPRRGGRG